MDFKETLITELTQTLLTHPNALAMWEAGSAANKAKDHFSDIDLIVIAEKNAEQFFEEIETRLQKISSITHRYIESKSFWPGCFQRIYFFKDSPQHFFLDLAIIAKESKALISEFLEIEKHGTPVVLFDKEGLVVTKNMDPLTLNEKHRMRVAEIDGFFPVYLTLVQKEIARGKSIDAFAFYMGGVIRPLVELLGIIHRPFRFDFGLRYLHTVFPEKERELIHNLIYVHHLDDLKEKIVVAEKFFKETRNVVQQILNER